MEGAVAHEVVPWQRFEVDDVKMEVSFQQAMVIFQMMMYGNNLHIFL